MSAGNSSAFQSFVVFSFFPYSIFFCFVLFLSWRLSKGCSPIAKSSPYYRKISQPCNRTLKKKNYDVINVQQFNNMTSRIFVDETHHGKIIFKLQRTKYKFRYQNFTRKNKFLFFPHRFLIFHYYHYNFLFYYFGLFSLISWWCSLRDNINE